jgi:hypothetical protein
MFRRLFSCSGEPTRADGKVKSKISYIGKLPKNELVSDSYITSCLINKNEPEIIAHIYACNVDKEYLLNEQKNKSMPMLRILVLRQSKVAQWKLVDLSVWFYPNDVKDIKLKKENGAYKTLFLEGVIKYRANTFNNGEELKETIWFQGPNNFGKSNKDFIESIRVNEALANIIDQEWSCIKNNIAQETDVMRSENF